MARLRIKKWALWLALACLVLSIALAVIIVPQIDTDVMLPYALVGYVLAPFGVAAALVWARSQDLRFQGNPLYLRLDGQKTIKLIGLLVAIAFLPAFVHIWYIASYVTATLS